MICKGDSQWKEAAQTHVHTHILFHTTTCETGRGQEATVPHRELSSELCDDPEVGLGSGREASGRGYVCVCVYVADSLHHTAETNTTLQSLL